MVAPPGDHADAVVLGPPREISARRNATLGIIRGDPSGVARRRTAVVGESGIPLPATRGNDPSLPQSILRMRLFKASESYCRRHDGYSQGENEAGFSRGPTVAQVPVDVTHFRHFRLRRDLTCIDHRILRDEVGNVDVFPAVKH